MKKLFILSVFLEFSIVESKYFIFVYSKYFFGSLTCQANINIVIRIKFVLLFVSYFPFPPPPSRIFYEMFHKNVSRFLTETYLGPSKHM